MNTIGAVARRSSAAPAFTGLLDTYSGAAVGYSLRRLRAAYSGNCIKVRRQLVETATSIVSDDYLEVGIVNNVLDEAALVTFATVPTSGHTTNGDVFVNIWYDQSGSGNDASQSSASAQPKIVSSGSVLLDGGKPAMDYDGVNDNLRTSKLVNIANVGTIAVMNLKNVASGQLAITVSEGSSVQLYLAWNNSANNIRDFYGGTFADTTATVGRKTYSLFTNSTRAKFYQDNIETSDLTKKAGTGTSSLRLGQYSGGSLSTECSMQEFVLWESNEDANRTAIESNINAHYSIYP